MKKRLYCLALMLMIVFSVFVSCDKKEDDADIATTASTATTVKPQDNDNHVDVGDL